MQGLPGVAGHTTIQRLPEAVSIHLMSYTTRWKSKLGAALHVIPTCALAASYHSEPNPVGEQVYSAHLMRHMLPVGIIVCALLLAWLVACIRRRGAKLKTQGTKSSD
jgi:hypothetical protein